MIFLFFSYSDFFLYILEVGNLYERVVIEFDKKDSINTYGWDISPKLEKPFYFCSDLGYMLGGFGNFGMGSIIQKTYSFPQPHWGIDFKCKIYKIDSWDAGAKDSVIFEINDKNLLTYQKPFEYGRKTNCGNPKYTNFPDQSDPLSISINRGVDNNNYKVKIYAEFQSTAGPGTLYNKYAEE